MSGTVTALGSALLGLTACVLVGGVSQAATEDARASAAADLAALAAADAHRGAPGNGGRTGAVDPCPLAASVAARNGTQLAECTVEDSGSVRVTPCRLPAKVRVAPNSPSARANASTAPDSTPGATSGRVTRKSTRPGRAPRVAATAS